MSLGAPTQPAPASPPASAAGEPADSWLARVVRAYRRASAPPAVASLLVANAIPLVGVLFLGWQLQMLLVVYWVENGIVGLWNIPRILIARGPLTIDRPGLALQAMDPTGGAVKLFLIPFFVVHYGLFWLVHGVFVVALTSGFGGVAPLAPGLPAVPGSPVAQGPLPGLDVGAVALTAVALFVSHGISFFANYVGGREYEQTSATQQMFAVYGRVLVLHLTILFGAFLAFALGSPIGLLAVLALAKTILDLRLHAREHAGRI